MRGDMEFMGHKEASKERQQSDVNKQKNNVDIVDR